MLSPGRQSARMSKITNDGLTRSGTGCFTSIWQQWASKGPKAQLFHTGNLYTRCRWTRTYCNWQDGTVGTYSHCITQWAWSGAKSGDKGRSNRVTPLRQRDWPDVLEWESPVEWWGCDQSAGQRTDLRPSHCTDTHITYTIHTGLLLLRQPVQCAHTTTVDNNVIVCNCITV